MNQEMTDLLKDWQGGDREAAEKVSTMIYAQLYRIATQVRQSERRKVMTISPTGLVNEAYLRLEKQQLPHIRNRGHFFALASKIMRQIMVDLARRRRSHKRGSDFEMIAFEENILQLGHDEPNWVALDRVLSRLSKLSPRKAMIAEMRIFSDIKVQDLADHLHLSQATVLNEYRFAKAWIIHQLNHQH